MSGRRSRKSMTFGESTSGKLLDFECGPWRWYKGMGEIHMNSRRVGEKRGGKEIDGCPLTLPPLQKCSITTCKNSQEVARSTLVKGIESKMATLIWNAAPGYLQWNWLSSALHVVVYAPPIDCDSR
jgi:hypothetical protein